MSRRIILAFSVAIGVAFQGAFLAVAPQIAVLKSHATRSDILKTFRMDLYEEAPAVETERTAPTRGKGDVSSIEDLFQRDDAPLTPDTGQQGPVDVPNLTERLADEALEREHDLTRDVGLLSRLDAKILEIDQSEARKDVEITRRLVRPSSTRVVQPNEFPTLRDGLGEGADEVLLIPGGPSGAGGGGASGTGARGAAQAELPPEPDPVPAPELLTPELEASLPELPMEELVGRESVAEEIREQSPYEFMDDLVDMKLATYVPAGEEQGFFRLQIIPKANGSVEVLPKDVTFIIDASNSILQRKLDRTADALVEMLDSLRPEDHFNIVVFRDTPTEFQPERVPATEANLDAARRFLDELESRGETDVYNAIRPMLDDAPRPGVPGLIFVITDGRPTSGVKDGRTIINALSAENTQGNTIWAFGGGRTVNSYLLDLLAYRNKGESNVAPEVEDIDDYLPRFFQKVHDPILVELNADYSQINEETIVPKAVPDFYRGRVVTIYGRFDPKTDKNFSLRLTGNAADHKKEMVFRAQLDSAEVGDTSIARQWAFERIYYLIGEICRVGEQPALVGELRELSRRYDIRTSYSE